VQSPGGAPDGTVRVTSDDGASCSAPVAAAECSLSPTAVGSQTLTATYGGSDEFAGSAGAEGHTVSAPQPVGTTTRITADDPDPSDPGQAVTVRFTVTAESGAPMGTVMVGTSGSGDTCSANVVDGACSLTLSQPGDQTLTATFVPAGNFAGSTDTERHTVRTPPPPPPPPPIPSATASSVEVKDASIAINHRTDVTVVVRDAGGKTLEHITVTLAASGDGNAIDPASATTDKKGEANFHFQSSAAGTKTLTAVAGGVTLAQRPTITVTQGTTRTSVTSDAPDPSAPGEVVQVGFSVASDDGAPTGAVTVTASSGEGTFDPSTSDPEPHSVAEPAPPPIGLRDAGPPPSTRGA
jgi:Big-like domain-containing protein